VLRKIIVSDDRDCITMMMMITVRSHFSHRGQLGFFFYIYTFILTHIRV